MNTILVTGGRNYDNRDNVFSILDRVHAKSPITLIVHGACCKRGSPLELTGSDRWAQEWAQDRQIPYMGHPAQWALLGDAAEPRRNQTMLWATMPHWVIAFPGGSGTADMVQRARQYSVRVWEVEA